MGKRAGFAHYQASNALDNPDERSRRKRQPEHEERTPSDQSLPERQIRKPIHLSDLPEVAPQFSLANRLSAYLSQTLRRNIRLVADEIWAMNQFVRMLVEQRLGAHFESAECAFRQSAEMRYANRRRMTACKGSRYSMNWRE